MSLPTYSITCAKCALDSLFFPFGTAYRYRARDGSEIEASMGNGWCASCDGPVKIQPTITPDFMREQQGKLEYQLTRAPKRSFFGTLFGKSISPEEKLDLELAREELTRIKKLEQLVGTTVIPARCLACGSISVAEFHLPEYGYESLAPLPFSHPTCGGQLMIVESGRWSIQPKPPVFVNPQAV
jgi:hypothetical protein